MILNCRRHNDISITFNVILQILEICLHLAHFEFACVIFGVLKILYTHI